MLTRQQPFSILPLRLCFFSFSALAIIPLPRAARLGGGGRSRRNAARLVRTDPSPAGSAVRFIPFHTRPELVASVRPHPRLPPARPGVAVATAAAAASFAVATAARGADRDARGAAGPLAPRESFPAATFRATATAEE
jgi:hypothetical protein